ncbi:hypothetical protein SDC9_143869 [bioreactor metagenome]|uniref:GIY-YIG domain-containing protein n=1 Tax=bioreactor metagenome TaxID=1076179 RepID=A0A645E4K3_9ZZZZ
MESSQYFYDRFYKEIDTFCFECGRPIRGKERYFPKTKPEYYDDQFLDGDKKYEANNGYFYYCSDDCKYASTQKMREREGEWQDKLSYEKNGGVFGYIYHIYNRVTNQHYIGQTQFMPFFRWQEHVRSKLKGDICDLVFETICEVRIKSQEYLNSIEAWWIQKYIQDYGNELVLNLTAPKPTIDSLIDRYNEMVSGQINFERTDNNGLTQNNHDEKAEQRGQGGEIETAGQEGGQDGD